MGANVSRWASIFCEKCLFSQNPVAIVLLLPCLWWWSSPSKSPSHENVLDLKEFISEFRIRQDEHFFSIKNEIDIRRETLLQKAYDSSHQEHEHVIEHIINEVNRSSEYLVKYLDLTNQAFTLNLDKKIKEFRESTTTQTFERLCSSFEVCLRENRFECYAAEKNLEMYLGRVHLNDLVSRESRARKRVDELNGDWCLGEFRNDMQEGYGEDYYAALGTRYQGDFKNGKREGQGKLIWDKGD